MQSLILVTTTMETREDAQRIADVLLDSRLIACAQISGPILSRYRWQGTNTTAEEYLLTVKSIDQLTSRVMHTIEQEHPYEVAEILCQKIDQGSQPYIDWVVSEVQS